MRRREFLKYSALLGAGALFGPVVGRGAVPNPAATVALAKGPDHGKLAIQAIDALGGMGRFVSKGQTVVVKPNMGWDRTPSQAANTNPLVLTAVVRLCLDAGAARVKVFDRTCNDPRRCYVTSGIQEALAALKDPRVELTQIDERRFRQVDSPDALIMKRWAYYEEVLDADRFINVPVAKHHSAAVLTMGMKNIMGVIGGNRATLHRNLPEALVDMNRVVISHLTVIDATRVLTANGPQGGRAEDVKVLDTVVAGTDVVATDTTAAALMGKAPGELRYLQLAQEAGLGVADVERIKLLRVGG